MSKTSLAGRISRTRAKTTGATVHTTLPPTSTIKPTTPHKPAQRRERFLFRLAMSHRVQRRPKSRTVSSLEPPHRDPLGQVENRNLFDHDYDANRRIKPRRLRVSRNRYPGCSRYHHQDLDECHGYRHFVQRSHN